MKKIIVAAMVLSGVSALAQNVGINTTTPVATLDVVGQPGSTLDGIIAPRLSGADLRAKSYTAAQTGAFVYATAADTSPSGQTVNITSAGYYYFDGSVWVKSNAIATGPANGNFWGLTGNTGTRPQTNYLGTNDANALVFKVNNTQAGYLSQAPTGTTAPGGNTSLGLGAMQNALATEAAGVNYNSNVAIGVNALSSQATAIAVQNVAVGPNTLSAQTTGSTNIAVGSTAMQNANNGNSNIAIGVSALQYLNGTNNGYNVAIGYQTGRTMTAGQHNVLIGTRNYSTNGFFNSGTRNILIGQNVGQGFLTGDQNIAMGASVALADATSNQLNIGSVIYGTGLHGSDPKISITPAFSQTNMPVPTETFDVNGTARLRNLPANGAANAIYTSGANTTSAGRINTFAASRTVVADANGVMGYVSGLPKTAVTPPADSSGTGNVGTPVSLGVSSASFAPSLIVFNPANSGSTVGYSFTRDGSGNWVLNFTGETNGTAVAYDVMWLAR